MSKEKVEHNANPVGATSSRPHFEENAKKQTGITLIALIITIIVMLILVAVSVTVAINGGLFNKTKQAAEEMEIGAEKDILSAAALMAYNHETDYIDLEALKTSLEVEGWTVETENGETVYRSPSNKKYTVGQNFEVAYIGDVVEESVKHLEDDNNPLTIGAIEDLVDLSIAVNEGTTYEGETITLLTSLDFDNPESYRTENPQTTIYTDADGNPIDINGDETAEPIMAELTTGLGFKPIYGIDYVAEKLNFFSGTFEGNGKTISNLYINRPTEGAALFGLNGKATVQNLTIKNPEIYGTYAAGIGIVFGALETENDVFTISNCHTSKGRIGGVNNNCISECASGLIFTYTNGNVSITECTNSSTLSGLVAAGIANSLICGQIEIKKCENYGNTIIEDIDILKEKGSLTAGCVFSREHEKLTIEQCSNYGTFNAIDDVSGISITCDPVVMKDCKNYATINSKRRIYLWNTFKFGKWHRCN